MDADRAAAAVTFACLYPFAIFYSAAYTEGLFLLAMIGAWYHLRRDERWPAFGWGLLAGLTRPNGCLLSIPLALVVLAPLWRDGRLQRPPDGWGSLADRMIVAAAPGLGHAASTPPMSTTAPATRSCGSGCRRRGAGRTWAWAAFLAGEWESVGEQGLY